MPRQPTVVEATQKILMDAELLPECDETREGTWGPTTKGAWWKAVWECAYPDGLWTWDQCVYAEKYQPESVPRDLEAALHRKKARLEAENAETEEEPAEDPDPVEETTDETDADVETEGQGDGEEAEEDDVDEGDGSEEDTDADENVEQK